MKNLIGLGKTKTGFLVILFSAIALSSIVSASIPDSNGTIHGCYNNNSGNLKVIDTAIGVTCSSRETRLNWNQSGPGGLGNSIVMGNKTIPVNSTNWLILNIPGFGPVNHYSDDGIYSCAVGSGSLHIINYTNTSASSQTLWSQGSPKELNSTDQQSLPASPEASIIVAKGNEMASLNIQGSGVFDSNNNLISCKFAWKYSIVIN